MFNTRYIIYLQIPEMIDYARCDTHYLMDIYHCMKDELLDRGNDQKNLLHAVYTQSNSLCKFWRIFRPFVRTVDENQIVFNLNLLS